MANGGKINVNIANAREMSLASPFASNRRKYDHASIINDSQIIPIVVKNVSTTLYNCFLIDIKKNVIY